MHPLLQGILLGLTISVMPGAPLFTLLQTSIHRGLKSGFFLATGIFLSDVTVVCFTFLGALQFINQKNNYMIAGIIGGFILIGFGIYTFYHKVKIDENNLAVEVRVAGPVTYMLKGFFLNIMNPFVWILWISAMVGISSGFRGNKSGVAFFFIGTLASIYSSDIFKVFIANKIKQKLKPSLISHINHLVGLILVIIGISLIISAFTGF